MLATPTLSRAADARQGEQWAVAPGTVFDLPGAWALTRGRGVVVAVVDSGTRLDHPDLARNIWTNFGEVPNNHKDDDGNGYVDDVHGVDLTSRRKTQNLRDGNGHIVGGFRDECLDGVDERDLFARLEIELGGRDGGSLLADCDLARIAEPALLDRLEDGADAVAQGFEPVAGGLLLIVEGKHAVPIAATDAII